MSKRKEMIHIFDSIANFNYLSKYSSTLSKLFQKNCLKDYVSSLKNPIHVETYEIFKNNDEEKNEHKKLTLLSLTKNQKKKKEINLLNDDGVIEVKEDIKKKNKQIKTIKSVKNFSKTIDILDPFKYNPNYNSIFKNVHSFRIVEHKTLSLKNKNSQNLNLIKKNMKIKKLNLDNDLILNNKKHLEEYKSCNSDSSILNNKNKLKNKLYKTLPVINNETSKSKNKTNSKFDFNNTRRFSKYSSRKSNIYKVNNRLTYLEPFKYSLNDKNNKSVDFKKMIKRNSKLLMNNQILKNPSIYYYKPKYNLIDQRLINIIFNKKDIKRKTKKYMLKKIWSSYNVSKDYCLVDNNKLNNEINIKIQN